MNFTTKDGRSVSVGLQHRAFMTNKGIARRTTMWLHSSTRKGEPINIEAHAVCSAEDNFDRKVGRMIARERFMAQFENERIVFGPTKIMGQPYKYEFDREDRRTIYEILCPEFQKKKVKPKLKVADKPKAVKAVKRVSQKT